MRDLYNPSNNTINLSKLSMVLKLETPQRDSTGQYIRSRSSSLVDDQTSLSEIINMTLQKLKRKPQAKVVGKLMPLEHMKAFQNSFDLNPMPKLGQRYENDELIFLDDLTQEDKFYLI